MKTLSTDVFLSYTNGAADEQFTREMVREKVNATAMKLAREQRDRVNDAVAQAAAEGARGVKVTWSAPKIEVLK